ncbi:MAG: sulfurtransferase [Burkholderiaceae bacterium]
MPTSPASIPAAIPAAVPAAIPRLVLNIAAYRFVPIADPAAWIAPLKARCEAAALKGTIIVASEGINLFVAGDEVAVDGFVTWLAADPRLLDVDGGQALASLEVRRSWSAQQPFRRLRIKQKPEIVTMRRPAVMPVARRAPAVTPEQLARWLAQGHDDKGRPIVLLDTRNGFEVDLGTFDGARHLGIERFDAFPGAVDSLRDELRDETIVTFCTGGIRCEKAALYMQDAGFTRVLQLDGGILNYFDRVGDAHWNGTCFVFDERRTLGVDLGTG